MSTTQAIIAEGLQVIPLASINPNPDNPRKQRDAAALQELADSIKAQGVWEPIVVRPDPIKPKTFELVMGERRWRASKLAGKTDIPAIVRDLSDRQALEAMILENLQREDVQPIDEARGYRLLLDSGSDNGSPAHTVDSLASKIGKSASYVHARLKLLVLIPAAAEALSQGHISAGHAVLIARLQPIDQLQALAACFANYLTMDQVSRMKKADIEKTKLDDVADLLGMFSFKDDEDNARIASEKFLRQWIAENINLKLKGVPWDLADAQLLPEAGACTVCPKRSLSNPMLFADLTGKGEDTCFDPECYQKKRQKFVKLEFQKDRDRERAAQVTGTQDEYQRLRPLSEQHSWTAADPDQKTLKQGQWLEAKKGECPSVEAGVITKGEHAGERRLICANRSCKVHKHNLHQPARPVDPAKRAESEKEREEKNKADQAWGSHLQALLCKSVNGADRAALLLIAELVAGDYYWSLDKFYGLSNAESKFRKEMADLPLAKAWSRLVEYVLYHLMSDVAHADTEIAMYAKAKKLDLKKLEKTFRASLEAQTSANAKPGAGKGVSKKKSGGGTKPSRVAR